MNALRAFRNHSLERAGEYFVLDGRLHGPSKNLPVVVEEGTTTDVVEHKLSLDDAMMVVMLMLLGSTSSIFAVEIRLSNRFVGRDGLVSVLAVFSVLSILFSYALVRELHERFTQARGADLVLRDPSGTETKLSFHARDEAMRVRKLIVRD